MIPDRDWSDAVDDGPVTFTSDALPFDVVVGTWLKNCDVLRKGPMFQGDSPVIDGYVLKKLELA